MSTGDRTFKGKFDYLWVAPNLSVFGRLSNESYPHDYGGYFLGMGFSFEDIMAIANVYGAFLTHGIKYSDKLEIEPIYAVS